MNADLRSIGGWVITIALAGVVIAGFVLGDPTPEDRVATLGAAIKCPVCQGEAIIDSPSETASAMMELLEEKVAAGETDQQIVAFFQSRFGDGIYLDPPFQGKTVVVWLTPVAAIAGGLWLISRRRRRPESLPVEQS
ncbi:MAG TPA: cytochrome c-type biogenesis protein [Acidimicrobiia bacterium]